MKTISNKTHKPLSVPLPGGKKLHLPPGKSGQIADNAVDHPQLKKMLDAGDIAIVGAGHGGAEGAEGGAKAPTHTQAHTPQSGGRRSGDR
jgi:hypothetical protein